MATQKNLTLQVVAAAAVMDNLELMAFWAERMITIVLTLLWIHSSYYFLVYLKEPKTFEIAAFVCAIKFLGTIVTYLFCEICRPYIDQALPEEDRQALARKKWGAMESRAFWIERFGILIVLISSLPLEYIRILKLSICALKLSIGAAPCLVLFPYANFLYLRCFIFAEEWDLMKRLDQSYTSLEDKFIKFKNWLEANVSVPDEGHQDRVKQAEEKGENAMEKEKSDENAMDEEEYGTDSDQNDEKIATDEYDGCIPDLEEVKEAEEDGGENSFGVVPDKAFSEESFEVVHDQNDHQIREYVLELEKKVAIAKENYQKMKKVEHDWEKKVKKLRQKHEEDHQKWEEERQMWKKEKLDFVARLSSSAAQTEIYRLQAQEKEENCHRLEDEKTDLITKLCAANSSSQLYRSLLHDIHAYT